MRPLRILISALAVSIVAGLVVPGGVALGASPEPAAPTASAGEPGCDLSARAHGMFPDVPCDHNAYDAILRLHLDGYLDGYLDGLYRPGRVINRVEAAQLLYRLAGSPAGPPGGWPDPGYADVASTDLAFDAIAWFTSAGLTQGYLNGSFQPLHEVNRKQLVLFLYRYVGSPPGPFPDPGYADTALVGELADAAAWAHEAGVMIGWGTDGDFHTRPQVTRAIAAIVVHQLLNSET